MGQELTKAVFTPPPVSYDDTLEGLAWVPAIVSSSASLPRPPAELPSIPTVFLDWRGPNDESACFTLLYCNGSTSDLGLTLPWLKILRDTLHVNVAAFDYVGYGLHAGSPSEAACYDSARSVLAWLSSGKGIPMDKLIACGKSIGSAVAIDLVATLSSKSSHRSALGHFGSRLIPRGKTDKSSSPVELALTLGSAASATSNFAGLILQSPFTSILALDAAHKFHMGVPDMFESLRKLKRVSCPVLVAHGQNDNLVPKAHSKKIVRKLENLWKRLELEGVGHHDIEASHDYLDALVEFVEFLMPQGTTIKSEIVVPKLFTETPNQIVARILGRTGMEQYTSLFLSQGYMDPFIISSLEPIDVTAMGISDPEHAKAVCRAIECLKKEGHASSSPQGLSSSSGEIRSVASPASARSEGGDAGAEQEATTNTKAKRTRKPSMRSLKQVEASLKSHSIRFEELARERVLKAGFFEEVYLCRWNGQMVIARNMPAKAHQYEQFARYAASIMSFKHPNLLVPLAVCTEEPNLCLVSAWMEKGSLYDVLAREGAAFSPLLRAQIALGVAEALAYLHAQGSGPFLHNDLTSRNVLLDGSMQPRVANFGLSRPPSFLWMAPEVFTKKRYSPEADIFSLAVVLWEILTGCRPHEGTPPSVAVLRVAKEDLRPPLPAACHRHHHPGASSSPSADDSAVVMGWTDLISSCWHADPACRPAAASVVERLRELFHATLLLTPEPSAFSFAETFVPYAGASSSSSPSALGEPETHRQRTVSGGSSLPTVLTPAVPSPQSAPPSLSSPRAAPPPIAGGTAADIGAKGGGGGAPALSSVSERVVNVTVAEMEAVLHDMQCLLRRVHTLQERFDHSSDDEGESSTSDDASESDVAASLTSSSSLDSPPLSPVSREVN